MTQAVLAGAVLVAMAALAVHDARRAMVDPRAVLVLLGAAAAWRFAGTDDGDSGTWFRLADGVVGAALGVACVMVPIGAAQLLGRRWPLYPGDAMLLGAFGFLLGVPGLAWTMLLGSGLALIYRFWLQRRRGRPFRKGLVPLGPGMCAAAAVVFVCTSLGVAFAAESAAQAADAGPHPIRVAPLPPGVEAGDMPSLPATELVPAPAALPSGLAAREVSLTMEEKLPFPTLVRRVAAASGVEMSIEERPSRIAGGALALPDPPMLRLSWNGPLRGLLDRVARLSGYDWAWETLVPGILVPNGGVAFHRFWDIAQRAPETAEAAEDAAGTSVEHRNGGGRWDVDPAAHKTLRGVLEAWAVRAGWTLVWNADRDYVLGAAAVFEGSFLEAADLFLSGPATRQALDARAYPANRHLVVDDAGGAGW
ncbi:MAG: TcpQ domain-containing protein [Rhodospirillales bacterium]|nr:TcpQ domain-containing protein [Rhodospirillales bacterium]MDE0378489.1 TcpQ domain-containing protein [Rhodospirillales bacterium]